VRVLHLHQGFVRSFLSLSSAALSVAAARSDRCG
jgi:uncharacterized membrane protein required for colicin V production